MIPHAGTSIRESNNRTVMGRSAQEVIGDIQMSDWGTIERDFKGKTFLFDNEGLAFEGREGQNATYEARVQLPQQRVSLGKDLEYSAENMRKIAVEVEFTPNGVRVDDKAVRQRNTKKFNFPVANQSQIKVK